MLMAVAYGLLLAIVAYIAQRLPSTLEGVILTSFRPQFISAIYFFTVLTFW